MTPARGEDARTRLAELTWPQVGERARAGAILAVPIGATEQHGPHLPLATDTAIAVALCDRLACARDDVLVAPPVTYGASGEHAGFPGTLSIGQDALELLVVELVRSASETFDCVMLVSAHGGNAEPLARAVLRLRAESREVRLFTPQWRGDAHAGRPETSMMLALTPDHVVMSRAVRGDTRPLATTMPLLRGNGVRAVSESGILGDPRGATASDGQLLLNSIGRALLADVAAWRGDGS